MYLKILSFVLNIHIQLSLDLIITYWGADDASVDVGGGGVDAFLFCCTIVFIAISARLLIESSSLALVMHMIRPL